jgi:hypothetical protein
LFVAMGIVDGRDLASLLACEGRLAPERALRIVAQLAEALDTARWSRGLVHGAVRPSEVLIVPAAEPAPGERVLLAGFGLRQEPPYLTPEQIEGRPVSPRSDVYALACVLFECLTGKPPFSGDPETVRRAHLREPPPSAARYCHALPRGIDRVIGTAMSKWPEERYSTCAELAASAQAALAGRAQPGRARSDERLSPRVLPPRAERGGMLPLPAADEDSAAGPGSLGQRLRTRRAKSIVAIALAVLLAATAAGVIWLSGRDVSDASSAAPSPSGADASSEVAAAAEDAPGEPPAQAEPAPAEAEPAAAGTGPVLTRLPGSLVRIDAATGEVLARIAIPFPKLVAADSRSVWVLGDEGASAKLVRVEEATNAVAETFRADVALDSDFEPILVRPTQLVVAGGSAWAGFEFGHLLRFAPGASAGGRSPVKDAAAWFGSPFAAAGSLWVRNGEGGGGVIRVDARTRAIVAGPLPFDRVVAAGPGFLWALAGRNEPELLRVDAETNEHTSIGTVQLPWDDLTFANGSVWAPSPEDGAIVRLDWVSGEAERRIVVGGEAGPLAAGAGAVWAVLGPEGAVARYDLATGRVETIAVGGVPNDLTVAGGSVWVAVDELGGSHPLPKSRYLARARAICEAATGRFRAAVAELGDPSGDAVASALSWNQAAARISEEALVELHSLTPPEAERAALTELSWLFERRIELLAEAAMAALNHDLEWEERLSAERVALTRRAEALVPELNGCPAELVGDLAG